MVRYLMASRVFIQPPQAGSPSALEAQGLLKSLEALGATILSSGWPSTSSASARVSYASAVPTHVILLSPVPGGTALASAAAALRAAASRDGVACIVNGPAWVNDIALQQQTGSVACPDAEPIVICSTGFGSLEREQLRKAVSALGARYSAELIRFDTTTLVVRSVQEAGAKIKKAREWDLQIVDLEWLEQVRDATLTGPPISTACAAAFIGACPPFLPRSPPSAFPAPFSTLAEPRGEAASPRAAPRAARVASRSLGRGPSSPVLPWPACRLRIQGPAPVASP